ncbi:MAG: hypothetical protein JO227_09710 [Acetobacteraceae bacterium]|nr:hypothetical protein [Acetobacteraceae bacterium]
MTRQIRIGVSAGTGAVLLWSGLYLRAWSPPGCSDFRTLSLVREDLGRKLHLPRSVRIENVKLLAGGLLALRFECEALLVTADGQILPSAASSGTIQYTSRFEGQGEQKVTVAIEPLLKWEKVE